MIGRPLRVLVTGASGTVGAETLVALRATGGVEAIAAVRDPARHRQSSGAAPARRLDFTDPSTWDGALEGMDALFLMRPPAIADIGCTLGPFVDLCAARGVRKLVFLSLFGVERMPYVPHHAVEARIRASGIPFVFLRPSFFMQNLTTTHREEIAREDLIFVPAGRGRTNFIDARDLGEVAAKVLVEPGHEGRAYDLTGPEALDYDEVARLISAAVGRPIGYARPSLPRFVLRSLGRGRPLGQTLVMAGLYAAAALGKAGGSSGDFEALMGRKARDFAAFAGDSRGLWDRP